MSFTFDPTTDRGRVRLLVADTDQSDPDTQIFEDGEIDAFLSLGNNEVFEAAALACESVAASASRSAIAWRALGQQRIDKRDVPEHYRALADRYREKARSVPAEEIDAMQYNLDAFGDQIGEFVGDEL